MEHSFLEQKSATTYFKGNLAERKTQVAGWSCGKLMGSIQKADLTQFGSYPEQEPPPVG